MARIIRTWDPGGQNGGGGAEDKEKTESTVSNIQMQSSRGGMMREVQVEKGKSRQGDGKPSGQKGDNGQASGHNQGSGGARKDAVKAAELSYKKASWKKGSPVRSVQKVDSAAAKPNGKQGGTGGQQFGPTLSSDGDKPSGEPKSGQDQRRDQTKKQDENQNQGQGEKQNSSKKDKKTQSKEILTAEEKRLKEMEEIPKSMELLRRVLEEQVGLNRSFDVVLREMTIGKRRIAFFYCNGFANNLVLTDVLDRLTYVSQEEMEPHVLQALEKKFVPHTQVEKVFKMPEIVNKVLAGSTALFVEYEQAALVIDAKQFPVRSTEEPELERVVRGSRDGFVETLLTNVTLVRRRIRDPRLKFELLQVGERSKTDVCLAYIGDIADMNLVEAVRDKITGLKIDGLPLADKQLEEAILGKTWNPYPLVRYTERPDVAAAHLLEGHLVVLTDTSPSNMILPSTFFHHVQHAEEYRETPLVGTYFRWIRFLAMIASVVLIPLWVLLVSEPYLKPHGLEFLGPSKPAKLPLIGQFLIAEFGVDMMRMAAIHTPGPLVSGMAFVAAVLLGDIAVKTGLFVNEVILYIAVATIGIFATPSYELGAANRIVRIVLLIAVSIFKIPGLIIGLTLWVILLATQRSFNTPYLWPWIPFNGKEMLHILIRKPFMSSKTRLSITKPRDKKRKE